MLVYLWVLFVCTIFIPFLFFVRRFENISEVTKIIETIYRPDPINYPNKPWLVRKISTVYQFSLASLMCYLRCMNLCRFKTKGLANKFYHKLKKLEKLNGIFDYEELRKLTNIKNI